MIITPVLAHCYGQTKTLSPTLLHKSTVDNPDGALKRSWYRRWRMASCTVLAAHCLDPPEEEDHDAHYGNGSGDARPHCQVKRCQQRENVDLLLWFAHQDPHWIVQVAFAEIHHTLTLGGDGDGWYGQVGSLWVESHMIPTLVNSLFRRWGWFTVCVCDNIMKTCGLKGNFVITMW